MASNVIEIRCFCRRNPLLAMGGRDTKNAPFVQVKAVRGGHDIVHAIIHSGSVSVQCRECGRWHKINIKTDIQRESPALDSLPREIIESEVLSKVYPLEGRV
jgi:hypothetical protein